MRPDGQGCPDLMPRLDEPWALRAGQAFEHPSRFLLVARHAHGCSCLRPALRHLPMGQTARAAQRRATLDGQRWCTFCRMEHRHGGTFFHETKMETAISSSPWIYSLNGWKSVPCPLYTVGGLPSSSTMTWLPVGVSRAMSRLTMALNLWAALHGCAKVLVSSITTSPLATVRPTGRSSR